MSRRLVCALAVAALGSACEQSPKPSTEANAPAASEPTTPPPDPEPAATDEPKTPPTAKAGPPVRDDGTIYADAELMGTRVSLNVWLPPGKTAAEAGAAMQSALDTMTRVEDLMSEWRPASGSVAEPSSPGGEPMIVSEALVEVLARAKQVAEHTDGAFDPTFHGVGQLWSFKPGATPPTPAAIADKLPLVGHAGLEVDVDAKTVRLTKPGMMLGLGAIAKGYAVDEASSALVAAGLPHHVVEAGGDTFAAGTKGGKPWAVGIQRPGQRGVVGVLPTSGRAVVTSGDYQRFFEHEGKRYAHILDPKTGWPIPAERSPRSVTLVADNAMDADAYATAVAVMGVQAGMAFVEATPTLEAVVIDGADKVHISSGLRDEIVQPK